MAEKSDIQRDIDSSRLISRMAAVCSVASLVMLVLTVVLHSFRGGDVFMLGRIPYALALLFSAGAYFYGTLKTAAALDEEKVYVVATATAVTGNFAGVALPNKWKVFPQATRVVMAYANGTAPTPRVHPNPCPLSQ